MFIRASFSGLTACVSAGASSFFWSAEVSFCLAGVSGENIRNSRRLPVPLWPPATQVQSKWLFFKGLKVDLLFYFFFDGGGGGGFLFCIENFIRTNCSNYKICQTDEKSAWKWFWQEWVIQSELALWMWTGFWNFNSLWYNWIYFYELFSHLPVFFFSRTLTVVYRIAFY